MDFDIKVQHVKNHVKLWQTPQNSQLL